MQRIAKLTDQLSVTPDLKTKNVTHTRPFFRPARVLVTGAAGNIAYSILFGIGRGGLLGHTQPIDLVLLDIPQMKQKMEGVVMELNDCAFKIFNSITATVDYKTAFSDIDIALLIGARPRGKGMVRSDLLKANAAIFQGQGKALNTYAPKSVKVVVVGNPANTNALIAMTNAPNIPRENFTAMTRLDQNRSISQLSNYLNNNNRNVQLSQIRNVVIWGNHSKTQYPDVNQGYVKDYPSRGLQVSLRSAVSNNDYLNKDFISTVQQRGAAIIKARGLSSAASAAWGRDFWRPQRACSRLCCSIVGHLAHQKAKRRWGYKDLSDLFSLRRGMKLLKPNWVSHDGNPIFSVDLHPDGSRFATGGQGDGGCNGKVVVWNTLPVTSPKAEQDENVPRMLCVMENHLACVNCVRWSCNGRYLASGGDDRIIMIWQFTGYGKTTTFGMSDTHGGGMVGERWRVVNTLKKHTGDVLHLAWSPNDEYLASCSIDNTIVIWNASRFPEITSVLRSHSSLVKGVTWDPVGTYIASQSDDKSIKIWKTLDWKLEATVTKPFEECGATTHVLRLDWSPDGGYLVSAHAMNNSGPTAQIIERSGWKTNMDFVGHRKAITCTRFNGRMFHRHPSKLGDKPKLPYTCCAVGSRDRSLSIWLTSLRRPLVVVNDLFDDSIMDISWSYVGHSLICCSWDGSVAYLEFKPEEIGEALSREEMNDLHKKTYGKSMSILTQPRIIENPAMLAIQQKNSEKSTGDSEKQPTTVKTPTKYPTKQTEVRTPNGKRRITPIFVAPQEELGGVPRPFGSAFGSSINLSSNLSRSPSKLSRFSTIEKKRMIESDKAGSGTDENSMGLSPEKVPKKRNGSASGVSSAPKDPPLSTVQENGVSVIKETKIPEQKKSILDSRITEKSPSANSENLPKIQKLPSSKSKQDKKNPDKKSNANKEVQETTPSAAPSSQPKKPGRPPGLTTKRKTNELNSSMIESPKQPKRVRKDNVVTPGVSRHSTPAQQSLLSKLNAHATTLIPTHKLPPKKVSKLLSIQMAGDDSITVKLYNDPAALTNLKKVSALHRVVASRDRTVLWETVLSSPGLTMDSNTNVTCVACNDSTMHLFSSLSGRRIFSTVCLRSKPYVVKCNGWNVMAVCSDASINVWDVKVMKSIISNQSFSHLIPNQEGSSSERRKSKDGAVEDSVNEPKEKQNSPLHLCDLVDSGMPLITLENKNSYSFSLDIQTWVLVNNMNETIEQCTDYKSPSSDAPRGILDSLQKKASGVGASALKMFHSNPPMQRSATLAFLEGRVETCVALNSVSEYKYWLLTYVRHLVNEGIDLRLRELCDELLGPTYIKSKDIGSLKSSAITNWKPYVLGLFKRGLLRDEVLPVIGSNLNFQRLYTEYQDQLDVCLGTGSILTS